jgi:hypothetical protein
MPCRRLTVHAAPGTERWALRPESAQKLACMLSRDATIHFWPRRSVRQVWERVHGEPMPELPPYAFRAWSNGDTAHVFVDDTETPESARWLVLHELAHLDLAGAPLLHNAYRSIPRPSGYLRYDAVHEAQPEEQMANLVADQLAALIGSRPGLDRTWWRRRVVERT